jgi:hypothetical protein
MEMLTSAIQNEANPDAENIIGLKLVVVEHMTVQAFRLLL